MFHILTHVSLTFLTNHESSVGLVIDAILWVFRALGLKEHEILCILCLGLHAQKQLPAIRISQEISFLCGDRKSVV